MDNLQRIFQYSKKYWGRLVLSIVTATLYGLFSAAPTYALKYAVDYIFTQSNERLIIPFIAIFVLLFALKGIFAYLSFYYMHWVGNKVVNDLRHDLFSKMVYYPLSFFKERTTGELMAHFLNDISMIQNAASRAVKDGFRSFFEAIFLIGVAFFQSWRLALVSLIIAPVIILSIKYMGRAVKQASRKIQSEAGLISSVLQEIFVGIREVKIFGGESVEQKRFLGRLSTYFSSVMRNVKIEALGPAFMETVAMLGGGVVFYIAAKDVLSGAMTPGQLTAFFAALLLAYQPIKRLITTYAEVQYGLAAADRVFAVMDLMYPALLDRTVEVKSFEKSVEFKNVSFSYGSKAPVLQNASFTVNKGDKIGLLGPSGSGKSTLCDLLLGFIEPTGGHVLIDGKDITKVSLESLRTLIGSVSQQTFLFNGTIRANIEYAQKGIVEENFIQACRRSHAHEFISQCPDQLQTMVGENGALLSGGQKQRVTIARMLLKNPQILIFDEATSALDQKSEETIRQMLEEISDNKTLIVISHRLSFIEKMDRILTIQHGRVVELSKSELHAMMAKIGDEITL